MKTQPATKNSNIIRRFDRFHRTRTGYLLLGIIELLLAYIFISIAIDTANLWSYLAAIILVFGAIFNLFNFLKTLKR